MVPRKKEMFNMIQTRESALCKLKKTHDKLKEVRQLDSTDVIYSHSFL